jgi:hypothetical protein
MSTADGTERLGGAVHEISASAAVDVQIDIAWREIATKQIYYFYHVGRIIVLMDGDDLLVLYFHRAAVKKAILQYSAAIDEQSSSHFLRLSADGTGVSAEERGRHHPPREAVSCEDCTIPLENPRRLVVRRCLPHVPDRFEADSGVVQRVPQFATCGVLPSKVQERARAENLRD